MASALRDRIVVFGRLRRASGLLHLARTRGGDVPRADPSLRRLTARLGVGDSRAFDPVVLTGARTVRVSDGRLTADDAIAADARRRAMPVADRSPSSDVTVLDVIAMATAVPIGLGMGLNRYAKGLFDPVIEFYWPLPPLAYLPLMIIWLGIGETSKVTLLTLAMFAPICLSAQSGVRGLPVERVNAALSLGGSRWQVFRSVVLPSALPEILTGMRIAVGVGWSTLVAAELIAATRGIGFMIMSAAQFLATDVVFVGIGVIAACAFAFSLAMRLVERWLVPWHGRG